MLLWLGLCILASGLSLGSASYPCACVVSNGVYMRTDGIRTYHLLHVGECYRYHQDSKLLPFLQIRSERGVTGYIMVDNKINMTTCADKSNNTSIIKRTFNCFSDHCRRCKCGFAGASCLTCTWCFAVPTDCSQLSKLVGPSSGVLASSVAARYTPTASTSVTTKPGEGCYSHRCLQCHCNHVSLECVLCFTCVFTTVDCSKLNGHAVSILPTTKGYVTKGHTVSTLPTTKDYFTKAMPTTPELSTRKSTYTPTSTVVTSPKLTMNSESTPSSTEETTTKQLTEARTSHWITIDSSTYGPKWITIFKRGSRRQK